MKSYTLVGYKESFLGQDVLTNIQNKMLLNKRFKASLNVHSHRDLRRLANAEKIVNDIIPNQESFFWIDTTKYFRFSWLDKIEEHQGDKLNINDIYEETTMRWFNYIENEAQPDKSRFNCRICVPAFDEVIGTTAKKGCIHKIEGCLSDQKENKKVITEHWNSLTHQRVREYLYQQEIDIIPEIMIRKQIESDKFNSLYEKAIKMMRLVYVEVKSYVPYDSHKNFVLLLQENDVDVGHQMYHRFGARDISNFIANEMHTRLIKHLTTSNEPVSMILDSTTDYNHDHSIIM